MTIFDDINQRREEKKKKNIVEEALGDIGDLLGIGTSDAEDALSAAQVARFNALGNEYLRYRPIAADARYNQLAGQFDMYAPVQQMASQMFPDLQPFNTKGVLDRFKQTTEAIKPQPPTTPGAAQTGGGSGFGSADAGPLQAQLAQSRMQSELLAQQQRAEQQRIADELRARQQALEQQRQQENLLWSSGGGRI